MICIRRANSSSVSTTISASASSSRVTGLSVESSMMRFMWANSPSCVLPCRTISKRFRTSRASFVYLSSISLCIFAKYSSYASSVMLVTSETRILLANAPFVATTNILMSSSVVRRSAALVVASAVFLTRSTIFGGIVPSDILIASIPCNASRNVVA